MKKGIFLHFMDKQLRISLKPFVSDDDCVKLILYALIMSDRIYTLVTHIIESAEELPQTVKLLLELERLNLVTVISNYDTIEDLIIGRQELYYYDKEEYPCYYREESPVDNLYNCLIFKDSTTKIIESKLGGMHKRVENIGDCRTINDYLNYVVTQKLNDYHGEGLTIKSFENNLYDLLRGGVENRKVRLIGKRLDRELIYLHQSNYLHKTYSSIICNFPGLTFYDDLDKDKTFDFIIYCSILQPFWKSNGIENLKIKIIQWKTRRELHSVTNLLADVIEELHGKYILLFQKYDYKVAIQMIAGIITDNRNSLNLHKTGFENAEELENYITYLCKKTKIYVDKNGAEKEQMRILLPVANMTEFESIMNVAEKLSIELKRIVKGNNTYHICENEDKIIAIVKCEAGTLGAASSLLTVTDAIFALDIHTVIFSGIAFGNYLKKGKDQQEGDLLVSRQIWNYETGKLVNGRFISRGDKVTATPWLLDRFQNSALIWKKSKIHFGLIASGEKLVNSTEFREKLIREEPELIGGEMEGNGLVAIAERYKKDWILVKGISDWGANKSDGYQKVAAENSFEFVLKTIIDYF